MDEDRTGSVRNNNHNGRRVSPVQWIALGLIWAQSALAQTRHFELPAGDARVNLNEFSRQAELQLMYDFKQLKGMKTQPVSGDMDPVVALKSMLRGLPIEYSFVNSRTLAITIIPAPGAAATPHHWWRKTPTVPPVVPADGERLEQVTVAGSSVLNEEPPVGASLIKLSRVDIENTGLATTQDLLRTLPEVFGGGPTEDTKLGREAVTNSSRGSGVNLRGLDAGATLVLVDGQRVAPSGGAGLFSDVANIPLSAIDHVDLLPDGAAARYGADAIGGVVNFVLRSDFDGGETQLRDGKIASNSLGDLQFSQLLGARWGSGNAMVGVEYYDRDALPASDRAQATSDLRPFGGSNFDQPFGAGPGTISIGSQTWAIPQGKNGKTLSVADLTPGTANFYDQLAGTNVLPHQRRWSAFGTLRDEMGDDVDLFADALFTDRKVDDPRVANAPLLLSVPNTNPFYLNPTGGTDPIGILAGAQAFLGPLDETSDINTGSVNLGATWRFASDWSVAGHAGYTFEKGHQWTRGLPNQAAIAGALADPDPATALDPFGNRLDNNAATLMSISSSGLANSTSDLKTLGLTVSGSAFPTRVGNAKLTVGMEYRDQALDTLQTIIADAGQTGAPANVISEDLGRRIFSQFAELAIAVAAPEKPLAYAQRLQISLGARNENYSDVGHGAVPKLGLLWSPVTSVALRGTWSKSFRPPALSDLPTNNSFNEVTQFPDSKSPTGSTSVLIANGTNPNLTVERARTWTLGAEFTPAAVTGLSVAATYFDTYYSGRIENVDLETNILELPQFAWLVKRNFTAAERTALCSQTIAVSSLADCLNAPIDAIIDDRLHNVEHLQTRGIDLLAKYAFENGLGNFDAGLNGTYLFSYIEAKTPGSSAVDLLSTQNNPIDFRFRASLSWQLRSLGASLFTNFSNGYRDVLSEPNRSVRSWTTFDLQLRYRTGAQQGGMLGNTEFAISAQNIFNSSAPFLNNGVGIGYDQENADLTGRTVSVSLRKRW